MAMDGSRYRLGCDVGGTFTDFVLLDEATERFELSKVLTTPDDPSQAVEMGLRSYKDNLPDYTSRLGTIVHGTTLVINAIIERKGAHTALITTEGFRDILEMRREVRYDMFDLAAEYPLPLIDRSLRLEVPERILADGHIHIPLDEGTVVELFEFFEQEEIESVAVSLLHAYSNDEHEVRIRELAQDTAPQIEISISSEVHPEMKEFERTSSTVLNAYVKPLVRHYISKIEQRARNQGYEGELSLILSGGGITSSATAMQFPVRLIESGPVGGAIATQSLGKQAGLGDVISFDMGGTTAKTTLIANNQLPITKDLEVDRVHRFKSGSGTPTAVPSVDLIEIGAGGGSIARVGKSGILEVGPDSSGANPGPVCYGKGGADATVTDADVVLGYVSPSSFLGGRMQLDLDAAKRAVADQIGTKLGLDLVEAAAGVHEVVNENMASAMRMYVAERGGDVSNSSLVAFGGAGPVHAYGVASSLGIPEIVIPRGAGVFSSFGFLAAPVAYESTRTYKTSLTKTSSSELLSALRGLEEEAGRVVSRAAPKADVRFEWAAEMSYVGQGHTIRVSIGTDTPNLMTELSRQFDKEYEELYGLIANDVERQIVTLIATAIAEVSTPPIAVPFPDKPPETAQSSKQIARPAYDFATEKMLNHTIVQMDALAGGMELRGPLIVEEEASTTVIGSNAHVLVDRRGWLRVDVPVMR